MLVDPESLLIFYIHDDDVQEWLFKHTSTAKIKPYLRPVAMIVNGRRKISGRYKNQKVHNRDDGITQITVRADLLPVIEAIDGGAAPSVIFTKLRSLKNTSQDFKNLCAVILSEDDQSETTDKETGSSSVTGDDGGSSSSSGISSSSQSAASGPLASEAMTATGTSKPRSHPQEQGRERLAVYTYDALFHKVEPRTLTSFQPTPREFEKIGIAVKIAHRSLKPIPVIMGHAKTGKTSIAQMAAGLLGQSTESKVFVLKSVRENMLNIFTLGSGSDVTARAAMDQILTSMRVANGGVRPVVLLDDLDLFLASVLGHPTNERQTLTLLSGPMASIFMDALAREATVVAAITEKSRQEMSDPLKGNNANFSEMKLEILLQKFVSFININQGIMNDADIMIGSMLGERTMFNRYGITFDQKSVKTISALVRPHGTRALEMAHKIIDQSVGVAAATGKEEVSDLEITDAASIITGSSHKALSIIGTAHTRGIRELNSHLKRRIFGQDPAIDVVSQKLKVAMSGLNDDVKPIGSFLFVGSTGVGKTELAKEIAGYLGMNLIRIDMSEYSDEHALNKMIGSPPGYKDGERGGVLSNGLKEFPGSVVLLDEAEKAHPLIHNLFLQMMDNGEFRDGMGNLVSCRSAIIIFTANSGAASAESVRALSNKIGFVGQDSKSVTEVYTSGLSKALSRGIATHFPPEFRNRLDGVVTFGHISSDVAVSIAGKLLNDLSRKIETNKKIKVQFSAAVTRLIAARGYDVELGARPIARLIDAEIKTSLADVLDDLVQQDMGGQGLWVDLNQDQSVTVVIRPLGDASSGAETAADGAAKDASGEESRQDDKTQGAKTFAAGVSKAS
jgi:ATP-dependent Clp protease ATP-binding subunit ClpA